MKTEGDRGRRAGQQPVCLYGPCKRGIAGYSCQRVPACGDAHDTPVPGTQYLCSDPAALGGAAVQRRPLRWLEPSVGRQRARRFGGQTQVNEQLQVGTAALQQSFHSALCSIPAPEQYDSLSGLGDHYGGSGGTAGQFYMDQIPAQGAAHINGGARSQHKGRQSDAQTDLFVQRCCCKSQKQQADDGPIARIK